MIRHSQLVIAQHVNTVGSIAITAIGATELVCTRAKVNVDAKERLA